MSRRYPSMVAPEGHCRATPAPSDQDASQAQGEIAQLVEPWKDHHGPLPDYDSPIACVFDAGVQYAVELLAKELGVTDWTPCDGTEEYDGDLGGTLMNIVREAMPLDQHGERMWPSEVVAALSPAPGATAQDGAVVDRLLNTTGVDDRETASDVTQATPTIPAGMVADRSTYNREAVIDAFDLDQHYGPREIDSLLHAVGIMLAAAPKQAEQQGVERAARAMCVADGLDPDEHIIGGQATGFEDFGPLWQAEERSEGQLGLTNYKRLATAALATEPHQHGGKA